MYRYLLCMLSILALGGSTAAYDINVPVHFDTLQNGLRIITVPDTHVAVVSCRLYYFVGSMYEGPGTSGLSHMYEHMLFKGTKKLGTDNYRRESRIMASIDSIDALIQARLNRGKPESDSTVRKLREEIFNRLDKQRTYIRKDEIWRMYQEQGGTHLNAWTGDDMTAYIVTLPQNKVELFYWIESDRMRNTVLREFYSERDVVIEERHLRYENRPQNRYFERLTALFYVAHPYRIPTIGWMSDIRAYTRGKLEAHVKKYYTPDNALIVLVGNINPEQARTRIERYFGKIPRAAEPRQEVVTREPSPIGQTRFTVRDEARPRIDMMFHIPGYPHEDLFALDVAESILNGRSGRLYKRLVTDEKICTNAGAANTFRLHNGYFHVWALPRAGADPAAVESLMVEEVRRLGNEPPASREMEKVKNSIRMSFVTGLEGLEGLSDRLAWFERLGGWRGLMEYPDRIARVTSRRIPDIVARYCSPDRATIGRLLPEAKNARGEKEVRQ